MMLGSFWRPSSSEIGRLTDGAFSVIRLSDGPGVHESSTSATAAAIPAGSLPSASV